jgi:hypothetical protein
MKCPAGDIILISVIDFNACHLQPKERLSVLHRTQTGLKIRIYMTDHFLQKVAQNNWSAEGNLIMKSAYTLPLNMQNIDVVAKANQQWEFELVDKMDLERAVEIAEKKGRVAMEIAAAKLIREGMFLEKISGITGLPLEKVRSLEPA